MNFSGQLGSNEIFAALFNMIISQEVFADNISGTYGNLVDKARVDGSLYGDTKLYYSADVLQSVAWGNDAEAANLLALHRPAAPETQAIKLDTFRQIRLTVDDYMSKRAWGTAGAFESFNSVMLSMIRDTKKIYDSTLYNAYIGTAQSTANKGVVEVDISGAVGTTKGEEKNRLEAEAIAEAIANLFTDLKDVSRDYNDYGHMRSYDLSQLVVVWNSKYVNKIKKIDLPTIFHQEGLIDKFEEEILPARYFGQVIDELDETYTGTVTTSQVGTIRALAEADYVVDEETTHCFPGDALPDGATYTAGTVYAVDDDIICKVMHKRSVPYMSAFEVATSFFNPRALTDTRYMTFGHNTLEYLKNYPFITVEAD